MLLSNFTQTVLFLFQATTSAELNSTTNPTVTEDDRAKGTSSSIKSSSIDRISNSSASPDRDVQPTSPEPSTGPSPSSPAYQQPQGLLMPYEASTEVELDRNDTKSESKNDDEVYYTEDMKALSPPTFSGYIFDLDSSAESNLQDISGQESKVVSNLYLHFEPKKQKKRKQPVKQQSQPTVHITSYLADSDTAIPMTETEILDDARNKTRGADMISAFFIAPEDEVNEIDKTKYSGRPIVVSDLNEDLVRNERYTGKEATKTLTNDLLAPIQAAVSLSHEDEGPTIEKQVLHKEPVYKTYIEIQKSIPYEIKEVEEPREQPLANDLGVQTQSVDVHHHNNDIIQQQQISNDLIHQQQVVSNELPVTSVYNRSPIRVPISVYYNRYPMYYLPSSYIGNYIMRHSHENTGYNQVPAVRPILPVHYMLARYQPQVYSTFLLTHPYYVTPTDSSQPHQPHQPLQHQLQQQQVAQDPYDDQNGLQAEQRPQYVRQHPPFRSSHPVYSSQYPPYTYKVLSTMRSRNARTARSKQLCIEYGGFKPPMVPSVQLDEESLEPVKDKTDADEKAVE